MPALHITDIESAINWWRERHPSQDGITACAEVRALAEVYGLMVYYREAECDEASMPARARDAWLAWYASTPDAPCIAICSTSQGDAVCKGCGRTFEEVQHWTQMTPAQKRGTWRRITMEGTAWRFNRYAERALLKGDLPPAPTPAAATASAPTASSATTPVTAAAPVATNPGALPGAPRGHDRSSPGAAA